jgi:hypothetical protein
MPGSESEKMEKKKRGRERGREGEDNYIHFAQKPNK